MMFGGPVQIPGVIYGTNKLSMFAELFYGNDDFNGKPAINRTLPRSDLARTIWPATSPTCCCCPIPLSS